MKRKDKQIKQQQYHDLANSYLVTYHRYAFGNPKDDDRVYMRLKQIKEELFEEAEELEILAKELNITNNELIERVYEIDRRYEELPANNRKEGTIDIGNLLASGIETEVKCDNLDKKYENITRKLTEYADIIIKSQQSREEKRDLIEKGRELSIKRDKIYDKFIKTLNKKIDIFYTLNTFPPCNTLTQQLRLKGLRIYRDQVKSTHFSWTKDFEHMKKDFLNNKL
jgi:hypothetical protein